MQIFAEGEILKRIVIDSGWSIILQIKSKSIIVITLVDSVWVWWTWQFHRQWAKDTCSNRFWLTRCRLCPTPLKRDLWFGSDWAWVPGCWDSSSQFGRSFRERSRSGWRDWDAWCGRRESGAAIAQWASGGAGSRGGGGFRTRTRVRSG